MKPFEITQFTARADVPILRGDGEYFNQAALLSESAWRRRENISILQRTGGLLLLAVLLAAIVYVSYKVENTIP